MDTERKMIHVCGAKDKKDRYTIHLDVAIDVKPLFEILLTKEMAVLGE